jgi:hypothetical protein
MSVGRLSVHRFGRPCPNAPHMIRNRFWFGLCLGRLDIRWRLADKPEGR